MSGPMGGAQGRRRMIGKGCRRLATRGLKMGSYVSITYREPDRAHSAEPNVIYEGKIADKRVGGQDRESYVELKGCLRINEHGEVIAKGDRKRLMDAFIVGCEPAEPRGDTTPIHEKAPVAEQWGNVMTSPMGGMQDQAMTMVPIQMMSVEGMQCMSMISMASMMPMQQMQPVVHCMTVGSPCGAQFAQQMPATMVPMMGGWQQMQGEQQMLMMPIPMMQAVPAISSRSRERSRSRRR